MQFFAGYNGKNSDIINLINELLKIIYKSKFPNLTNARIGIGAKNRRSIAIFVTEDGVEWATNLFSAGAVLAGYDYSIEKSGLGVAALSGYASAKNAIDFIREVT